MEQHVRQIEIMKEEIATKSAEQFS